MSNSAHHGYGLSRSAFAVLLIALLGVILAGCSTTLRVGSDFDHKADFSGYHTFSLMKREHHESGNPLTVQRANDAIEAELTRLGFVNVRSEDQSDFVVDFTIGARDRMDVYTYPAAYGGYGWWDYPGWWGVPYWGNQVDVRQYREGTLSIDVFDARTHRPMWHGWAKKELKRADIEHSDAPIRAAVAAVLAAFPPH